MSVDEFLIYIGYIATSFASSMSRGCIWLINGNL